MRGFFAYTWVQKQGEGLTILIKTCAYLTKQGLDATVAVSVSTDFFCFPWQICSFQVSH